MAALDRYREIGWILDHEDDLDADFRRFLRIDLDEDDIDARRFVQYAQRVSAYGGVMALRVEAQRDTPQPAADGPGPAPRGERKDMELAAFRVAHPGLVTVSRATE